MKKGVAGALLWIGTRTGIIRRKVDGERAAFEDGVTTEANAIVIEIETRGPRLSSSEIALRTRMGRGVSVHDTDALGRIHRGEEPLGGPQVPLGNTERED